MQTAKLPRQIYLNFDWAQLPVGSLISSRVSFIRSGEVHRTLSEGGRVDGYCMHNVVPQSIIVIAIVQLLSL